MSERLFPVIPPSPCRHSHEGGNLAPNGAVGTQILLSL